MPPVEGTDAGLVGTSVGYVLSAHLREDALQFATSCPSFAAWRRRRLDAEDDHVDVPALGRELLLEEIESPLRLCPGKAEVRV